MLVELFRACCVWLFWYDGWLWFSWCIDCIGVMKCLVMVYQEVEDCCDG